MTKPTTILTLKGSPASTAAIITMSLPLNINKQVIALQTQAFLDFIKNLPH